MSPSRWIISATSCGWHMTVRPLILRFRTVFALAVLHRLRLRRSVPIRAVSLFGQGRGALDMQVVLGLRPADRPPAHRFTHE